MTDQAKTASPESSDETVRDLFYNVIGSPENEVDDVCETLGIDPDMPIEKLERRIAWGTQVEECGTQACGLKGEAFLKYQWRNALEQWKWWHARYREATGDDRGRIQIEMDER